MSVGVRVREIGGKQSLLKMTAIRIRLKGIERRQGVRYHIWQHIDTGIGLDVEADSEEEALKKAEEMLEANDYDKQILDNAQAGNPDVVSCE